MFYAILILIISLVIALFSVQNSLLVEVSFLSYKFETNLVIVILSSVSIGAFLALIWTLKLKAQYYLTHKRVQDDMIDKDNKIKKLEEEIKTLKAMALTRAENLKK